MTTRAMLAFAVGCPLLSGCVQGPPLEYAAFAEGGGALQGDYSGLTKFTLARSLILVRSEKNSSALVMSVPAEAIGGGTDFGIRQRSSSNGTGLEVTKVADTNLVDSVALRDTLARDPVARQPAFPALAVGPELPANAGMILDVQALLEAANPGPHAVAGIARSEHMQVAFSLSVGAVPTDAIPTASLDLRRTGKLYFYSACRRATVTFLSPPLARQAYTLTVADPNFVQTVAVNPGRTLVSHPSCGVDVFAGSMAVGRGTDEAAAIARAARTLSARWVTHPMIDDAAALAAVRPTAAPRANRRKQKIAVAPQLPTTNPVAPALPQPPANGPLRNTQIQVPLPRRGESFAF